MFKRMYISYSALIAFVVPVLQCCTVSEQERELPVCTGNESISSESQFNELMERMAMGLHSSFTFRSTGNTAHLVANSYWGDYSGTYSISNSGGKSTVTLNYPPYIRVLAAHRNPALESRLSDREKKALREAQRLIRNLKPANGDRFENLVNIHDHIIRKYETNYSASNFATEMLLNEEGDCWAHSRAFYLLAQMSDIPCHIVNGHAGGTEHSWNLVQMSNGEWYHLDTTWDDPITHGGDAGDTIKYHRYFLVCDHHMSQDHTWNRAPFPKSGTNHATYFVNRRLVFHNSADFWREARKAFYRGDFEFEGWISPYNEAEFRIELKKLLQEDNNLHSCGWIGPKSAEGSVRVLFN